MDYVDIESFRSKYSDLTVTAVPSSSKRNDEHQQQAIEQEGKIAAKSQEPRVEITRIPGGGASATAPINQLMATRHRTQQSAAALVYANEYKECWPNWSTPTVDENTNIEDKYTDLLNVLTEIRPHLPPTMIGVRPRKDCLLRDIGKARVLVRECLLLLESDQHPQIDGNQSQGSSP
ncbi:uncharacterized protein LOC110179963, partial [Drosophila serrata]|uniref:uncharacterized protein LOC110179963 n=1 Tax=Drosophila serrata TaxID=7274 RepID=UPI000A1D3718